jgi:hypothetical protein
MLDRFVKYCDNRSQFSRPSFDNFTRNCASVDVSYRADATYKSLEELENIPGNLAVLGAIMMICAGLLAGSCDAN